jgi:hypothetical protein
LFLKFEGYLPPLDAILGEGNRTPTPIHANAQENVKRHADAHSQVDVHGHTHTRTDIYAQTRATTCTHTNAISLHTPTHASRQTHKLVGSKNPD